MNISCSNEYKRIEKDLLTQNFSPVPFSYSRKEIVESVDAFFDFLSLSNDLKDELFFNEDTKERAGTGYVRRTKEKDGGDNKEFVHYHPSLIPACEGGRVLEQLETKRFLEKAENLYAASAQTAKNILTEFECKFPGITEKFVNDDSTLARSVLRFLKYEPSRKGDFLAHAHYDRGSMTFALAESAPGLRVGKDPETLQEVKHQNGMALFMPSYRFRDNTTKNFMPAWHDVVQSSERLYSENAARWAVVFFVDARSITMPTKKECETPLPAIVK